VNLARREVLKLGVTGAALATLPIGALFPARSAQAAYPENAFKEKDLAKALQDLFGTADTTEGDVKIKAPDIAENGAVVPITVSTPMSGVESITILVKENPSPLVAHFELGPRTDGYVSTRIKMGKTSPVTAVVKANGKLYSASKTVKVTIGGCGG